MAKSKTVTSDSIILDSKNPLTTFVVHPNGGTRILEETIAEMKELRL